MCLFFLFVFQCPTTRRLMWPPHWMVRRCWWSGRSHRGSWMETCKATWCSTAHQARSRSVRETYANITYGVWIGFITYWGKYSVRSTVTFSLFSFVDRRLWMRDWKLSFYSICLSPCLMCLFKCVHIQGQGQDPGPPHRLSPSFHLVSENQNPHFIWMFFYTSVEKMMFFPQKNTDTVSAFFHSHRNWRV